MRLQEHAVFGHKSVNYLGCSLLICYPCPTQHAGRLSILCPVPQADSTHGGWYHSARPTCPRAVPLLDYMQPAAHWSPAGWEPDKRHSQLALFNSILLSCSDASPRSGPLSSQTRPFRLSPFGRYCILCHRPSTLPLHVPACLSSVGCPSAIAPCFEGDPTITNNHASRT